MAAEIQMVKKVKKVKKSSEFGYRNFSEFGEIEYRFIIDNIVFTKYKSGSEALRPITKYSPKVLATIPVKTFGSRLKDHNIITKLLCFDCCRNPDTYSMEDAETSCKCPYDDERIHGDYEEDDALTEIYNSMETK